MEQGFLNALRDDPDDRLNHLAYADWLDEHGQAERADYIRAWWRVGELPRRERVAARAGLEKRHEGDAKAWLGPAPEHLKPPTFHGGVLSRLEVWPSPSTEEIAPLLERHAVRDLALYRVPSAAQLTRLPGFRLVRELTLNGGECDDFFLWAHSPPLRRLTLGDLSTSTARLLAVTPALRFLRSIGGRADGLDDAAVVALLRSPHLMGLKEWELTGDRVSPLSLMQLFRNGRAARWRGLTYYNQNATLAHVQAIGSCVNLRRLTLLVPYHTDDCPLGFLDGLPHLRELYLTGSVGNPALASLVRWSGLGRLELLWVRSNHVDGPTSRQAILGSPYYNPETHLDIP